MAHQIQLPCLVFRKGGLQIGMNIYPDNFSPSDSSVLDGISWKKFGILFWGTPFHSAVWRLEILLLNHIHIPMQNPKISEPFRNPKSLKKTRWESFATLEFEQLNSPGWLGGKGIYLFEWGGLFSRSSSNHLLVWRAEI